MKRLGIETSKMNDVRVIKHSYTRRRKLNNKCEKKLTNCIENYSFFFITHALYGTYIHNRIELLLQQNSNLHNPTSEQTHR